MTKSRVDKLQKVCLYAIPGEGDYQETVDWLEQFYPCTARMILTNRRILVVVGHETYVEEVWSMKNNHYRGVCHLEWKLEESDG